MNTTEAPSIDVKGTWSIDNSHSNLQFTVSHLVISQVNGHFSSYDGTIESNGEDLTSASIKFGIDTNSINTGIENRDAHLMSDDFFNAEAYPQIKFTSTNIVKTGENAYDISGEMTIRDITLPATFKAKVGGIAVDGYGNTKLGMRVTTAINRFDYGLKWNQLTEVGGVTVGKEVEVNANLQFAKQ
jgi:polyisoprenoid-binding protein YceI